MFQLKSMFPACTKHNTLEMGYWSGVVLMVIDRSLLSLFFVHFIQVLPRLQWRNIYIAILVDSWVTLS